MIPMNFMNLLQVFMYLAFSHEFGINVTLNYILCAQSENTFFIDSKRHKNYLAIFVNFNLGAKFICFYAFCRWGD